MNIRNECLVFCISIIFIIIACYYNGLIKFSYLKDHVEVDFSGPILHFRNEPRCSSLLDGRKWIICCSNPLLITNSRYGRRGSASRVIGYSYGLPAPTYSDQTITRPLTKAAQGRTEPHTVNSVHPL